MKRVALLVAGCFILVPIAIGIEAASEDVWILPAKHGTSEIVKGQWKPTLNAGEKPTVDMWIRYDLSTEPGNLLSAQADVETVGCWFQSPAKCSVLAFAYWITAHYDPTQDSCYLLGAVCPETFVPGDCGEYHESTSPCPVSPIGTVVAGPQKVDGIAGPWPAYTACTLYVANPPDVGQGIFFGGYSKAVPDSSPNPCVTGNFELTPPRHSLVWRTTPSSGGPPGWYQNWHLHWVVAQVRMYENPPPILVYAEKKSDTYKTADIWISDSLIDMGIPIDSSGVKEAWLYYGVNDSTMPETVAMTIEEGTLVDGRWSASIPGPLAVGDTVTYNTEAKDLQGLGVVGPTCKFIIRAGTSGNALVIASRSDIYGSPYSPNPWANISALCPVDFWYERIYGAVDSSVLYFYKDGPGQRSIFVHTFGADPIKSDSAFFMEFLNAGGRLAISSQDMAGDWIGDYGTTLWTPGTFIHDYLKVGEVNDDYHPTAAGDTAFIQYGITGDPISGADNLAEFTVAPYIWHPSAGYNYAGIFIDIDPACHPCFVDPDGYCQGYWYQDVATGYRVVNIYWPFQYIWDHGSRSADSVVYNVEAQDTLASRLCAWFGIEETPTIPVNYLLSEALPNPGSKSSITYGVPKAGKVSLKVYNVSGSLVRTLVNREAKPGTYTIAWDGHNDYGKLVPAGIYYYRLESGDFSKVRKFVLVR